MDNSLFAPREEGRAYGGFFPSGSTELAYRSQMIEMAIRADDVPKIKEAIAREWMGSENRCFDGSFIVDYCDFRKAEKCAEYLRSIGWPERDR